MTTYLIRAKQLLEWHVLRLLADAYEANQDLCYLPLKTLVTPEINREIIRAILIYLRKDGLATYAKGLWTDDGELAGSGYAITPDGRDYLGELELNNASDLQQALKDIRQLIHGAEEWCPFSVPELKNIERQLLLLDAMEPDDIAAHEIKKETSVCEHPSCDKPAWTELDNEKLCKFHATEWLKGEQQAADDYQAEIDQLDDGYAELKGGA